MVRTLILVFFTTFLLSSTLCQASLHPKGKRFVGFPDDAKAFGLFLGEPVALRGYLFTSWKRAIVGSVGYSFNKVLQGSIDYIFYGYSTRDKIEQNLWNNIIFYAGPGILAGAGLSGSDKNNSFQVGARIVGGSEYIFTDSPWSLRLEVAPQFYFKATESFGVSVGVGVTYYLEGDGRSVKRKNKRGSDDNSQDLSEFE